MRLDRRLAGGRIAAAFALAAIVAAGCGSKAAPVAPSAALPSSVAVSGAPASLSPGQASQLTAIAILTNGTSQDCTASAMWQSSNGAVVAVAPGGLATAKAVGAADVTATCQGVIGTTHLVIVVATVPNAAVTVSGASPMAPGASSQWAAISSIRSLTTQDNCSRAATWQSSNPAVATVSAAGIVTAVRPGGTDITATCQGLSGVSHLIVSQAVSVTITAPFPPSVLAAGQTAQLTATALLADATTQDCTGSATWQSSNAAAMTVAAGGLVTAVAASGSAEISATCYGVTGTLQIGARPSDSSVRSVTVTGPVALSAGQSSQLTATATLWNGATRDCTAEATWRMLVYRIATVSASGVVTALVDGWAEVDATFQLVLGRFYLNVTAGPTYTLSGTVRDEHGAPMAGATVQLQPSPDGLNPAKSTTTNAAGGYSITGLVPGNLRIQAYSNQGYYTTVYVTLTLTGDAAQDFALTPTSLVLRGTISEAGTGAPIDAATVSIVSGANAGRSAATSHGAFTFSDLTPGSLVLRAGKPGYDTVDRPVLLAGSPSVTANLLLTPSSGACLESVTPVQFQYFPSAGGPATISVTAAAGRGWTATPGVDWIQVASGQSGTGSGTVGVQVQPGVSDTAQRQGTVEVRCGATDARTVWFSQRPNCQPGLAWASDSPTTFTAVGGDGHIWVLAVPSCPWQAVSQSGWISLRSQVEGASDGDVHFTVAPNTTGAARTGTIMIGERAWQVTQDALDHRDLVDQGAALARSAVLGVP